MKRPIISIISAISENRAIGKDNKLLWDIPEDLKRFREITKGHPVIMGRKTYESIGRLLPDRLNIIITRDKFYKVKGAIIVNSLEDAINNATLVIASEAKQSQKKKLSIPSKEEGTALTKPEIFIIGGGQIYHQAIDLADKLYLTVVHAHIDGDSYFPDYSQFSKKVFENEGFSGDYSYTFLELLR